MIVQSQVNFYLLSVFSELTTRITGDCLGVDVVLDDGEDEPYQDEEGGDLVMEPEDKTVGDNIFFGKPLDDTLQDG